MDCSHGWSVIAEGDLRNPWERCPQATSAPEGRWKQYRRMIPHQHSAPKNEPQDCARK